LIAKSKPNLINFSRGGQTECSRSPTITTMNAFSCGARGCDDDV